MKFTNFCDPFATRSSAGTSDSGKRQSHEFRSQYTPTDQNTKPTRQPKRLPHDPGSETGTARAAAEQEAEDANSEPAWFSYVHTEEEANREARGRGSSHSRPQGRADCITPRLPPPRGEGRERRRRRFYPLPRPDSRGPAAPRGQRGTARPLSPPAERRAGPAGPAYRRSAAPGSPRETRWRAAAPGGPRSPGGCRPATCRALEPRPSPRPAGPDRLPAGGQPEGPGQRLWALSGSGAIKQ